MTLSITPPPLETGAQWKVYAIRYAERINRTRRESFIMADDHDSPHPMEFFVWLLRSGDRTILVDTGFEHDEASRRDRVLERIPPEALAEFGVSPESVDTVIVTHLHYDHAGTIDAFPNAMIHIQAAEMEFATGPCMCHDTLRLPFTADHVCSVIRKLYQGRVVFHEGDGFVAPGVTVHCTGGHSRGLQAVRVNTESGPLTLASDAAHYYEHVLLKKVFPITVDLEDVMTGYDLLLALAEGDASRLVPGHDPLVSQLFAQAENGPSWVRRLDAGAIRSPRAALGLE